MSVVVRIQEDDFDAGAEMARLSAGRTDVGGVATFVGLVRADKVSRCDTATMSAAQRVSVALVASAASVQSLTLEHYPGMTEKSLGAIVAQAQQRWPLLGVRVIHRVGCLLPGEQIVFVGVAASHRGDAFAACEFIIDFLKTQAPFWKKEMSDTGPTGQAGRWVDARESDDQAAQKWERR